MFTPVQNPKCQPIITYASVGLHCLLLAWLLHAPPPIFVAPSSVVAGLRGDSITPLYLPSAASTTSPKQKHEIEKIRLTWPKNKKAAQREVAVDRQDRKGDNSPQRASASLPAGSPFGSLSSGTLYGPEIRPALPVVSVDPVVTPNDLPRGEEGNVIVEITIDEGGNIVQKTVIQSLNPIVDNKVLAALEHWHFQPATRDGVAIASKQDVYYHFPSLAQQYQR